MAFTICGDGFKLFGQRKKLFWIEIQGHESMFKSHHSPGATPDVHIPYFGRKIARPEPDVVFWHGDLVIDEDWKTRDLLERLKSEDAIFDMRVKEYNKIGEVIAAHTLIDVQIDYLGTVEMVWANNNQFTEIAMSFRWPLVFAQ